MKKLLIIIFVLVVLVLLGIVAQLYEYETCKNRVERYSTTMFRVILEKVIK